MTFIFTPRLSSLFAGESVELVGVLRQDTRLVYLDWCFVGVQVVCGCGQNGMVSVGAGKYVW